MFHLISLALVCLTSCDNVEVVQRTVVQNRGDWIINYRLRIGEAIIRGREVSVIVDSQVSNSRITSAERECLNHTISARSYLAAVESNKATCEVLKDICKEHLYVYSWLEKDGPPEFTIPGKLGDGYSPIKSGEDDIVCVRLKISHEHFLHGLYDPLLGKRIVEIKLGRFSLVDEIDIDRVSYEYYGECRISEPSEDRIDKKYFISKPYSVMLSISEFELGRNSYRPDELPLRYNSYYVLSYWYAIAEGSLSDFNLAILQNREHENNFKLIKEECIKHEVFGRWVKVEHIFKTCEETTGVRLLFYLSESVMGQVWVDDIELKPLYGSVKNP